jgi:hypothetical protein
MEIFIKVLFNKIILTGMENIHGLIKTIISDNFIMVKNTDLDFGKINQQKISIKENIAII